MVKRHLISFKNAFRGFFWSLKTQPNFKVHLFLSLLSIFFALYFKIEDYKFLTILVLITMGFTIEMVNTAIEQATDAIDKKWREDIGLAKDISAAAMLTFSIGASLIGLYIFLPYFISLI